MTTRTTLSDEEMVQRRNMHHTPSDSAPFSAYFLIANARLEFSANNGFYRLYENLTPPLCLPDADRPKLVKVRAM
jgi:hypothetical protein